MAKNKNMIPALSIICIILAASLVVVIATSVYNKPSSSSLEKQVDILGKQIDNLNDKIADYEERIENLTRENKEYDSIIALKEWIVLLGDMEYNLNANETTELYAFTPNFAGYFEVKVESTSATTYIEVSYKYNNHEYNQKITVGTRGTAFFPVLPGPAKVILGNTGTEETVTSITLTYVY